MQWGGEDSNLRRHQPTDLQSVPFDRSGTSPRTYAKKYSIVQDGHKQEPMRGVEPPTCRLQIGCSAIELHRRRGHPHATARKERKGKINKMALCVNEYLASFSDIAGFRTQALRKPISGGIRQPPDAKPPIGPAPRRQHVEPTAHRRSHA